MIQSLCEGAKSYSTSLFSMSASCLDVFLSVPSMVGGPDAAQMLMFAGLLPCRAATTMLSLQVAPPQVLGAGAGAAVAGRARARWALTCMVENC